MKTSPWFVLGLGVVFIFGLCVLGVRLFRLQVLQVAEYREGQIEQSTRRIRVAGQRGRILDRKGRVLAECRPSHGIRCVLEEFPTRGGISNMAQTVSAAIGQVADRLKLQQTVTENDVLRHLRQKSALPLPVWLDVDDRTFAQFCERADEFPGFEVFTQAERVYPQGGLAAHVLGYTGRRQAEADPDMPVHYFESEMRGRAGTESFFDDFLAGGTGERRVAVDARGFRPVRSRFAALDEETKDQDVLPSDGLDLTLTLDIDIQRVVEEQLHSVTGACVVLDPRDGAVLAMASSPSFDPNDCVPRLTSGVYASLTNAPAKRGQNRAISEGYAPGSTFKPITALAGLKMGWMSEDEYNCQGVFRLGDLRLHCWDRYGHGSIAMRGAIEQSCNTFFCNLGGAVGTNAVIEAARAFGLGARTGIELGGEIAGVVPDDEWKRRWYGIPWVAGDTCQMSIGQGMLLVTPLQMAVVAAALANGGDVYRPYLHARAAGVRAPEPVRHVPFADEEIELVRQGMRDVAEKGTGRKILERREEGDEPVWKRQRYRLAASCAGKTGTAEIGQGEKKRKNTWVIAFAPYEDPTVAMAMVVERGESGGSTVAPRIHAVLASIFGENVVGRGGRGLSAAERGD